MSKVWVRLKEDPENFQHNKIGAIIRAYGHDFVLQEDKTLCMPMHVDFLKSEVKAGRVEIMDKPPKNPLFGPGDPDHEDNLEDLIKRQREQSDQNTNEAIETAIKNADLQSFGFDIGNYYGAGDLGSLLDQITALKNKGLIVQFADERFQVKLPETMTRDDLIDGVKSLVDKARLKWQESQDRTDQSE